MRAFSFKHLSALIVAALPVFSSTAPAQTVFGASRADDVIHRQAADGTPVALQPWNAIDLGPSEVLSFGFDWKERIEAANRPLLGVHGGGGDVFVLNRLLAHADLRLGQWRGFVQVGAHYETGRNGGPLPTDRDDFDVQQTFVEWKGSLAGRQAQIRLGRQEMAFDGGLFVSLRDGPNVRRAWDGVRATYRFGSTTADLFTVQPVGVRPESLDDRSVSGERLSGAHLTYGLPKSAELDAFYYDSQMPRVVIAAGVAATRTETLGARLRLIGLDSGDATLGYDAQWGRFGSRPVRAFAAQAAVGWTMSTSWRPRLFARIDVLSGGDPNATTIRTFNSLYPNYAYSTEAAIEAPSNLVEAALGVTAHPNNTLTIQYVAESLSRYSRQDAFYSAPGIPLVHPGPASSAYSGFEQQWSATWQFNQSITFSAAAVNFHASRALRSVHAMDESFATLSMLVRL